MSILHQKKAYRRIIFLAFFLMFWLTFLTVRLIQLQVFESSRLKADVIEQNQNKVKILPKRGTIYDRAGCILARSIPRKSVYYTPAEGELYNLQLEKIKKLERILDLSDYELQVIKSRMKKNKPFIWIKRKIDPEMEDKLKGLSLGGIHFVEESKRFYPKGKLAAHLLGKVNIDDTGLSGIELKYNSKLKGEKGEILIMRDARKREYNFETLKKPQAGKDLILAIEETIQYYAEKELEKAVNKTGANWGTVIISKPSTGEILAMANCPSWDLNQPPPDPSMPNRNIAIHYNLEPGSTFKVVTFAAALESGKVSPSAIFDCSRGFIPVAGKIVRDHKRFGILSFPEVISHSSNVGTIQISRFLDEDSFYRVIKAFGFGQKTEIDLPAEENGIFRTLDQWTRSSPDFLAIGYQISVTPIQMLQMINIIANKGVSIPLRIVKKILNSSEQPLERQLSSPRAISEETASRLTSLLEKVVSEGTGTGAQINGYRVAGKTGTTQKLNPVTKSYSATSHIASFVGFVPVESPALSLVVVLDEPKGPYYGGEVGAPIFREIASQVLRHLRIPPQKNYLKAIRAENRLRQPER